MDYIGLLDCNNFFVSCERLFRPDLISRPVVVLSGNDGCVVARSNEVKELGIPMGVPYFQVKKELSEAGAAIFSSNFTLYRDISARVMSVLRQETEVVEQYSVDEAFFTVTGTPEEVVASLRSIKQVIEQKVGVPVSVGAGKSKTIAKYASEKEKRGSGVCLMAGTGWRKETAQVPLSAIWGIGRQTTKKLQEQGLTTVADLLAADSARVERLFGVAGMRTRAELNEQTIYRLGERVASPKSIMSTRSFKNTTTDARVVEDALAYHVAEVAAELREKGLVAQSVSVLARPSRHSDWVLRGGTKEVILTAPSNDTRVLLRESKRLFAELYESGVPYKKAGIIVGLITESSYQQADLFMTTDPYKDSDEVLSVMDTLNQRFGKDTVTLGRSGHSGAWQPSRTLLSPHYTTQWSDLISVKAR